MYIVTLQVLVAAMLLPLRPDQVDVVLAPVTVDVHRLYSTSSLLPDKLTVRIPGGARVEAFAPFPIQIHLKYQYSRL